MTRAALIAAPASGSGKTTVTLGLLRALRDRGMAVAGAKSGPDYIDARFHEAACGRACVNLDAWAMPPDRCRSLIDRSANLVLVEGAMGLMDGAPPDGRGCAGDLAQNLDIPVIMVIDAARMAQSIRAILRGFTIERPDLTIAGVILNRVGSDRHAALLRRALDAPGLPPVLGAIPRMPGIAHPSRHLGLVQAHEREDLEQMIAQAGALIAAHVDLDRVVQLCAPPKSAQAPKSVPPAQHIAIAQDDAFSFSYPHLLQDWRDLGGQISLFSPLNDDAPPECDLILLPGGYPELYAGRLAGNSGFVHGMRSASKTTDIYGECGGYMALGQGLIDANGAAHEMLGLLPLETSFAQRKLHLGYRHVTQHHGPLAGNWTAHEFHYATTLRADGPPLLTATDAEGRDLGPQGLSLDRVHGSFMHMIDPIPQKERR